jgi:hypothetical protein
MVFSIKERNRQLLLKVGRGSQAGRAGTSGRRADMHRRQYGTVSRERISAKPMAEFVLAGGNERGNDGLTAPAYKPPGSLCNRGWVLGRVYSTVLDPHQRLHREAGRVEVDVDGTNLSQRSDYRRRPASAPGRCNVL